MTPRSWTREPCADKGLRHRDTDPRRGSALAKEQSSTVSVGGLDGAGEWVMNPQYRAAAQDCVRLAKRSGDAGEKLILLSLAQAWMKLSEQAATIDGAQPTTDHEVRSAT
jgi:hypothetical protein